MYLTQKKALVGERPSRLQRKQTCRNAYENYIQTNPFEEVDITKSETFKTLFRQSWCSQDNTTD